MNFHDLRDALTDAVAAGKIGVPVAMRVNLQLADAAVNLSAALEAVIDLAAPVLDGPPTTLNARLNNEPDQWNVLMQTAAGKTLFVTIGKDAGRVSSMTLSVTGNHGVIRLEGAEECEPPDSRTTASSQKWQDAVENSHRQRSVVSVS